jgi:hypothetical protein
MTRLLLSVLCLICVPNVTAAQAADSALALRSDLKPIRLALDCTNPEGRPAVIPGDYDGAFAITEVDERPRLLKAGRAEPLPSELVGRPADLRFRYVIAPNGQVEPCTISAEQVSDVRFVPYGLPTILKAQFAPGRKAGKPVRVIVEQRVTFN